MWAAPLNHSIYYQPAIYALRFPKIEVYISDEHSMKGETAFQIQIRNENGELAMTSDYRDQQYLLTHERVNSFLYTEYVGWARCMAEVGCVEKNTSEAERAALVSFYEAFRGVHWRFSDNWLVDDPCVNHWYGIDCNTEGNIIVIHLFENHLNGTDFP